MGGEQLIRFLDTKPLVYVSYAWRSRNHAGEAEAQPGEAPDREQLVDDLCHVLAQEDGILVGRDKQLMRTGDSIEDFAADIAKSRLIIAVISKKSLRSDWCMKDELLQAFRRRNFDPEEFGEDVVPLFLDDAMTDLEDDESLIDYWIERVEKKQQRLFKADPNRTHSPDSWKDMEMFNELLGRLPDLIRALRVRVNLLGNELIREDGFDKIRERVKRHLQEKSGFAAAIRPSQLSRDHRLPAARPAHSEQQSHFLALVLELNHGSSGEIMESLFSWQAYLKPPAQPHYEPCSLQDEKSVLTIGETVRASGQASDASSFSCGLESASLADLIQITIDWLQVQTFGATCVLELFLPLELLDFAWSDLHVKDRRSRHGQQKKLLAKIPFVLRCWDRFSSPYFISSLPTLEEKYRLLSSGDGEWLAGEVACSMDNVSAAETIAKQVAIKRLHPLDDDRDLRLQWLDAMQLSMVPVVLWQLHGRPERTEKELHDYLELFGAALNGHQHGNVVSRDCAQFEELACKRKVNAHDPLVHDIVFLMDHPGRAPAPATAASDLFSF